MLRRENHALLREYASETLVIEPWGKDSLRVRSTMRSVLDEEDWALQFATFSPVLRMHGDREPHGKPLSDRGGGKCVSGAPNELWSFGEEAFSILEKYLRLRERMRPYVRSLMSAAHAHGAPIIRPLFYDFPADDRAWAVEDSYMFGPDVLVAPVLYERQRDRDVYLPAGSRWISHGSGKTFDGGQVVNEPAPLDYLPVFLREEGSTRL